MNTIDLVRSEKMACLGLARYYAPMDTGNMRFNAINVSDTPDGFAVRYDLQKAFYIYFQEEGTKYSTINAGFIGQRTYPAIASYLKAKYESHNHELRNYYQNNARNGNIDIIQESGNVDLLQRREARMELSQGIDIPGMMKEYEWETPEAEYGVDIDSKI